MRAVIQRVDSGGVSIANNMVAAIERGLVLLIGITHNDTDDDARRIVDKTLNLRIFPSEDGTSGFDLAVKDIGGSLLLVSQFTLYASTRKGKRPGFMNAARQDFAEPMFRKVVEMFRESGLDVKAGVFGAMMKVSIENNGPATFILDSEELKAARSS